MARFGVGRALPNGTPVRSLLALAVPAAPFLIAAAVGSAQPAAADAGVQPCGKERWAVKTLTDGSDAAKVDLTHPETMITVEDLRRLSRPKSWGIKSPRLSPVETTTYRVKALLMSMTREDDSDIHLVIADPRIGGSMIAEFPAEACTAGASSEGRLLMKQARDAIATACDGEPPKKKFVTLTGQATIAGVGFFDPVHRQGGVAPYGIELHPVVAFESSTCKRVKP